MANGSDARAEVCLGAVKRPTPIAHFVRFFQADEIPIGMTDLRFIVRHGAVSIMARAVHYTLGVQRTSHPILARAAAGPRVAAGFGVKIGSDKRWVCPSLCTSGRNRK